MIFLLAAGQRIGNYQGSGKLLLLFHDQTNMNRPLEVLYSTDNTIYVLAQPDITPTATQTHEKVHGVPRGDRYKQTFVITSLPRLVKKVVQLLKRFNRVLTIRKHHSQNQNAETLHIKPNFLLTIANLKLCLIPKLGLCNISNNSLRIQIGMKCIFVRGADRCPGKLG